MWVGSVAPVLHWGPFGLVHAAGTKLDVRSLARCAELQRLSAERQPVWSGRPCPGTPQRGCSHAIFSLFWHAHVQSPCSASLLCIQLL